MAAQMTVVSDMDIDKLSDLILKKMESKFLRLPKEWRDTVQLGYALPPVQIPLRLRQKELGDYYSNYWLMEMYVSGNGGLTMRVRDEMGRQIFERTFL